MRAMLFSTLLLVAPSVATATAQAPTAQAFSQRHPHGHPHKAAARMAKRLSLSADQQARLEPILAERSQRVAAVRANTQLTDVDRTGQLKAIRKQTRAQMSSVLSPDQMQQMRAMHRARRSATAPPTGA